MWSVTDTRSGPARLTPELERWRLSMPDTDKAEVRPTGVSCEVEVNPYGKREDFERPTDDQIRKDAGIEDAPSEEKEEDKE